MFFLDFIETVSWAEGRAGYLAHFSYIALQRKKNDFFNQIPVTYSCHRSKLTCSQSRYIGNCLWIKAMCFQPVNYINRDN